MRRLQWIHSSRLCLALMLVSVAVLGVAIWLRTSHAEDAAASQKQIETPYQPVPMARTQRPTALFVGDGFTAGYGGVGPNGYPYIVCASLGLNCNVDAQTGTGFVDDGRQDFTNTQRLIDRLSTDQMIYTADVVIVDAGRNDLDEAPDAYGAALQQYLEEVKRLWPAATIVVIEPSYIAADPEPGYGNRIPVIRHMTESVGGILIDPVAEGWYVGVDASTLEIPEGTYPNQAGHRLIANKLAGSLQSHGIGQPGATD